MILDNVISLSRLLNRRVVCVQNRDRTCHLRRQQIKLEPIIVNKSGIVDYNYLTFIECNFLKRQFLELKGE